MPPDDQPLNVAQLGWRLDQLEKHVAEGFSAIRSDMRAQLTRLEGTVERMTFVDVKLYNSEQRAQDKQISDTARLIADVERRLNERVDDSNTRQAWMLGLLISALVVALAGGLVRLAMG